MPQTKKFLAFSTNSNWKTLTKLLTLPLDSDFSIPAHETKSIDLTYSILTADVEARRPISFSFNVEPIYLFGIRLPAKKHYYSYSWNTDLELYQGLGVRVKQLSKIARPIPPDWAFFRPRPPIFFHILQSLLMHPQIQRRPNHGFIRRTTRQRFRSKD